MFCGLLTCTFKFCSSASPKYILDKQEFFAVAYVG